MLKKATINNGIYDDFSDGWWDSDSFLNILETGMQPVRRKYIQQCLLGKEFESSNILDVGCGGGIITEDLANLGGDVTGIDASVSSLNTAKAHAQAQKLDISYKYARAESLPFKDETFDVVTCCDVLEHVDDLSKVIFEISRVLKPGGTFVYDTVNRTLMSYLSTILIAQEIPWTRIAPKNSHVWHKYIRPNELLRIFNDTNLKRCNEVGIAPSVNPLSVLWYILQVKNNKIDYATFGSKIEFKLSPSKAISYLGHCIKR